MGVQFGRLLGGTVIIQQVFGWPGMGRLALQAIMNRDYILFQAIVLLLVLGAVVINLVTDSLADAFNDALTPRRKAV